jgi:UDP-N-acetylglucosamine 2-epimerase (non-hydrolysing)
MKHIVIIVGARPNFIKAAPIYHSLLKLNKYTVTLVHTGQHYDNNMSGIFLEQLDLQKNVTYLDIDLAGRTVNTQISHIMLSLESYLTGKSVDLMLVFGDVTSTLAAALTSNKMGIKLAHVESGNRSFDKTMPEEVNRILVDNLCDYHFIAEPTAVDNLKQEGINGGFYVGNSMIDTLVKLKPHAEDLNYYQTLGLTKHKYILVTLHRPHNVENVENLKLIFKALEVLSNSYNIVFPVHPRKREQIQKLIGDKKNFILLDPVGYMEFMNLNINCGVLVTDSGGLQEETTVLKVPCVTLRPNTERPITCTQGTNTLIKELDTGVIIETLFEIMNNRPDYENLKEIDLWDGQTGDRIAKIIGDII